MKLTLHACFEYVARFPRAGNETSKGERNVCTTLADNLVPNLRIRKKMKKDYEHVAKGKTWQPLSRFNRIYFTFRIPPA